MNEQQNLSTFTWPIDSYGRSVNLKMALSSTTEVSPFRFTEKSIRLFDQILDATQGGQKDRAFSVIGPYGSGKSSFALFAASVLSSARGPSVIQSLNQLEVISPDLREKARGLLESQELGYFPIILQGEKAPFDLILCKSLFEAISSPDVEVGWVPPKLLEAVHLTLETLEAGLGATADVVNLYKQAAGHARASGYHGLFVVADEFGKFLERAAGQGDLPDLAAAQYLAELASSDNDSSILFMVLLHQSFRDYASTLSQAQRLEWNKIQGRFKQVDFSEDSENLYDLIAACLGRFTHDTSDETDVNIWAKRVFNQVRELPLFQGVTKSEFWSELLPSVYPFHPVALYGLPRLSSRLGQNERTLFTFLVSEDPLGFKRFLSETQLVDRNLPSLTFDVIVDYFLYGARLASSAPDVRRLISQLESALERLGDRPVIEQKILKILGGLQLLKSGPALPVSKLTLIATLGIEGAIEITDFESALEYLVNKKLVVHRKFSDEYHLWEGSDFDFERAISTAREEIQDSIDVFHSLPKDFLSRPLMAQQHGMVTGTARGFARLFLSTEDALRLEIDDLFESENVSGSDGVIIHTSPSNFAEVSQLSNWAKTISDKRILITVPRSPSGAQSLLEDLSALNKIKLESPEIHEDPVALKELEAREEGMSELLVEVLAILTDPGPAGPVWWWSGGSREIKDRRELNRFLSHICDGIYSEAPIILNELINRSQLPTAVVIAVKKIIERLLNNDGEEELSFEGNGPEISIFKAVFEKTRIYRDRRTNWALTSPRGDDPLRWLPAWTAVEEYLEGSQQSERQLSQLFSLLENRPYGMKAGVVPLFVWAVLIYHRDTVCIYHDGTYIRNWDVETFDLSTKAPDKFTFRWLTAQQATKTIVGGLLSVLLGDQTPRQRGGVNTLLSSLFDWYRKLPEFAQQTASLSEEGLGLRHAITTSIDPIDLLFTRIPVGLALEPFPDQETGIMPKRLPRSRTALLVKKFAQAIDDVADAYGRLQSDMVVCMADAFQCEPEIGVLKKKINLTASPIIDYVHDIQTKAFLARAVNGFDQDKEKWLEALGATLTNQSPRYWSDQHLEEFREKLALVSIAVRDAERSRFAVERGALTTGSVRLVFETSDGKIIETILNAQSDETAYNPKPQWIIDALGLNDKNLSDADRAHIQEVLARALLSTM